AGQRANDVMRMAFTSGTTGNPKGVIHSHNTTLSTCRTLNADMRVTPAEVFLIYLPLGLNWGYLTLVQAVMAGARAVLLDQCSARVALELIQRRRGGRGVRVRGEGALVPPRLAQECDGERGALHRRRLVPHGRPRAVRFGRQREDRRAAQGDDQPRRQEVLPEGDRGNSLQAPENPTRRHRRRARPEAGRAQLRLRDPPRRSDPHPGRGGWLSAGWGRDLQAAGDDRGLR